MPLVYLHGVNTRRGKTPELQAVFDNYQAYLIEQFKVAFADRVAPQDLQVFTPYWGELGATFSRDLACLPGDGVQQLSVGQPASAQLVAATAARLDQHVLASADLSATPLLAVARTCSLSAALDLLFAGAANAPIPNYLNPTQMIDVLPEAAQLAAAAEEYAASLTQPPAWLDELADDDALIFKLIDEVERFHGAATAESGVQSLGVGSTLKKWLKNGGSAVKGAVGKVTGAAKAAVGDAAKYGSRRGFQWFAGYARPPASALLGRFFGDVFIYLENRQPILDVALQEIDAALEAARESEHDKMLYLVGHSFGGIILYDILSKFRPDLTCELYVTVGSQVAMFAELGRLADKEGVAAAFAVGPNAKIPRPAAAKRWVNIFDLTDLIGFATEDIFSGVRDYRFETEAYPVVSHGAYFDTPRFFSRLKERVGEAFADGTD